MVVKTIVDAVAPNVVGQVVKEGASAALVAATAWSTAQQYIKTFRGGTLSPAIGGCPPPVLCPRPVHPQRYRLRPIVRKRRGAFGTIPRRVGRFARSRGYGRNLLRRFFSRRKQYINKPYIYKRKVRRMRMRRNTDRIIRARNRRRRS